MKFQLTYLFILASSVVLAKGQSQTCYYPNGDVSKENDIPCSSGGSSACCPQGWQCLDNGLCYLDNQKYYGRYTCTDKSWKSCPNQICTHSNTASGNEAILQCSSGNYCCDANRPDADGHSPGCCDTGGTQFSLKNGNVISSGSSSGSSGNSGSGGSSSQSASASGSSIAPSSSSSAPPPSSSSSQSQSSSSSSSAAPSSSSSAAAATTKNNNGGSTSSSSGGSTTSSSSPSVSIVTSVVTSISGSSTVTSSTTGAIPISQSQTPLPSPSPNNLGGIIGPAVGVPVGVIALAALAFFLWRRRRNNKRAPAPPPLEDTKPPMAYGKPDPGSLQATPDMARYSGNTLTQSPRFSEYVNSPELSGNYPQHYDPNRPQAGELPGSMYHPYNPNLPRELPA